MNYDYDLIVIGGGPGGYVAAIRAAQRGLKTALIEKHKVGGMCLNWGCMPTKSLLESAKKLLAVKEAADFGVDGVDPAKVSFNWKTAAKRAETVVRRLSKGIEFLLKKNKAEIINGTAILNSNHEISVENRLISSRHIIIATGSKPKPLPPTLPQSLRLEIRELLKLEQLPQHPVIYGDGPHAVELAQFFSLTGIKTALLAENTVLMPSVDPFLGAHALKLLKKAKTDVLFNPLITGYENGELLLSENGESRRIPCDQVINASTREAVQPEMAEDLTARLELHHGFIKVDDQWRTSIPDIYAVGDVNGRSAFAHAASAQGLQAVDVIQNIPIHSSLANAKLPVNIYTWPEMASVGMGEEEAKQNEVDYKISEFPLSANGKSLIEGFNEGLVRIVSEKKYGEVLGVQIIAPHATDMIAEAAVLMQIEGTIHDIAHTVHAHPTVSEIFMEAGFDAFDEPVHK